jgi:NAD(P)-dependent dehydrogenase (short-subunit alcohol dehydrogenase family)
MLNFQSKTIVVTGASSGIGAETARTLRFAGASVIGTDRNEPALTLDGFVRADLSEQAHIDAAVKQLPARVDALCNIAGVPDTAPAGLVGRVNYLGLRHLCQCVLERMPAGVSIVNISSILGAEWSQRLAQHKALAETPSFEAGLAFLARQPVPQDTCSRSACRTTPRA